MVALKPSILPSLGALVCLALVGACKPEAPSAAVSESGDAAAEPSAEPDASASDVPVAAAVDDGRTLWFDGGPGRAAIIARERNDHERAAALLDSLLADTSLSVDDRGVAQWLRGLEDLGDKRYADAAERFAEARKAPGLAAVDVRLAVLEAQARLTANQPAVALSLVQDIAANGTPHGGDIAVIRGDALLRTDDFAGAKKAYEAYLALPNTSRRPEVRWKLVSALTSLGSKEDLKEAVGHAEKILLDVPLSEYGNKAAKKLPNLRRQAGAGKPGAEFSRRVQLARTEAMVDRRRYRDAIASADKMLSGARSGAEQCRALFLKGSAIFKQRDRARARPVFDKADKACAKAGKAHVTTRVKARYQGARGLYAEGKYTKAAHAFEALAVDHHDHSYADDAWVLAGESWEEASKPKQAQRVYRKALATGGDMLQEARRRLLVMAFSEREFDDALALTESGLAARPGSPKEHAKLQYFRGRALAELSRSDEAVSAWVEAVRALPLGYASLQALSRLREQGPEALQAALDVLAEQAPKGGDTGTLPNHPAAKRALLLAKLGLGHEAREELSVAKVDGWPAATVLNDAGLFSEAQRLVANLGQGWRRAPPVGAAKQRWEAAHPRPFSDIIDGGERQHSVPGLLTWAIMQTESRFNPAVTSWAGARGLVQLMPKTAEGLAKTAGIELTDLDQLFDPTINLDLGQRYLGSLSARFGGGSGGAALAIPSYNGGAGNVDKWLGRRGDWTLDLFIESIPFDETRKYTQSVLGRWMTYRWLYAEGDAAERIPFLPIETPQRS